jgi:cobalt-zinc-cadmium resistance protein CzcA
LERDRRDLPLTVRGNKTAQDWILERQFKQVDGVIDVVGFGGETKQDHVQVDPFRLRGHDVTLRQLMDGVANATATSAGSAPWLERRKAATRPPVQA